MRKLFGSNTAVFALLLFIIPLFAPQQAQAADIRTSSDIIIPQNATNLKDLYLFGKKVQVNAPVTNDVVAAGGNVTIAGNVSNSVTAAGGVITIRGKIGNTIRAAGGQITIDGSVANDVVVAGGMVTISKNASVGGDVLIAGGQLDIEGPVHGNIMITGGDVTLNSSVGGNVISRRIGTLTLGPQAKINGNLTYSSPQSAQQQAGSKVLGKTAYTHIEKQPRQQREIAQTFAWAAFYRLAVGIILSILFIYFFRRSLLSVFERMQESSWKSGGIGFLYVLLMPIASTILLLLIWLGLASFLFYALSLLIGSFIANVFVGWFLMRWWNNRERHAYVLDWKAGVIGPIVLFILLLIPIVGWLIAAIIFFVATGALVSELAELVPRLQETQKKSKLN